MAYDCVSADRRPADHFSHVKVFFISAEFTICSQPLYHGLNPDNEV